MNPRQRLELSRSFEAGFEGGGWSTCLQADYRTFLGKTAPFVSSGMAAQYVDRERLVDRKDSLGRLTTSICIMMFVFHTGRPI